MLHSMSDASRPHDWNASDYDATNAGIIALGGEVLGRLRLNGDETVLDAGCGTGVLSAELANRLPRGRVIALDGAPQMVEFARKRFAGRDDVEVIQADLNELDLGDRQVDAIFSTATFHWIKDHDALWHRLRAVLRDGGQLVAQCGGEGNIAVIRAAYTTVSDRPPYAEFVGNWSPVYFAPPDLTERRLKEAGFSSAKCWLEQREIVPDDFGKHLREIVLSSHLERLPETLREPFAQDVERELGAVSKLDYVRLNVDAVA